MNLYHFVLHSIRQNLRTASPNPKVISFYKKGSMMSENVCCFAITLIILSQRLCNIKSTAVSGYRTNISKNDFIL